jgi:hypothetical protein
MNKKSKSTVLVLYLANNFSYLTGIVRNFGRNYRQWVTRRSTCVVFVSSLKDQFPCGDASSRKSQVGRTCKYTWAWTESNQNYNNCEENGDDISEHL